MAPAEVPENPVNLQPWLFEEPVQNAPGVRAVRAAALQRKVDQKGIAIPADRCIGRSWLHCASQVV